MKSVDQVRNSLAFLEDPTHEHAFDTLIWGLRERRDAAAREVPEWEDLRTLASRIKEHTLSHLADYLEQFERRATQWLPIAPASCCVTPNLPSPLDRQPCSMMVTQSLVVAG